MFVCMWKGGGGRRLSAGADGPDGWVADPAVRRITLHPAPRTPSAKQLVRTVQLPAPTTRNDLEYGVCNYKSCVKVQ